MSETLPRTAVVLGAGCSRDLGVPTMPTFMDEAFDRLSRDAVKNQYLKRTLEALLAFTRRIKGSAAAINTRFLDVEELYGLAEMANDLGAVKGDQALGVEGENVEGDELLRHFRRTLMYICIEAGRELIQNEEYRRVAGRIEQVKRESQSEDPDLFTDRGSRHANLLAYLGLASFKDMKEETYPLVIQFNWDLAFDRALYAYFRARHKDKEGNRAPREYEKEVRESHRVDWAQYADPSNHDFTTCPLVLRPHGGLHIVDDKELSKINGHESNTVSDDWEKRVLSEDNETSNQKRLYLYERAITKWLNRPHEDVYSASPDLCSGDAMAIEPPTWKKDVTHFLRQWQLMREYLKSVRRIAFIGYSLPRSDLYMRHFLALALAEADYVPQVTVWNPAMRPETETWDNYCEALAPLRRQGRLYALPRRFGDPALFDLERALHLAEPVPETL